MKKLMSSIFLLCLGLQIHAEFLSSEHILRGLIHSGSIDAQRLEDMMGKLQYDFDMPTRGLYPYAVINTPGFYRLADSVSGRQITITTSNVTLDMNGCTVSGATNGIVINSGLNNIVVKNGIVSDVSSDGVQINNGCSAITLDGLTVKTAARAVFCSNVTNSVIRNADLQLSNTGIELNNCHNIVLENCVAQTNKYAGFSLVSSTTCVFIDCQSLSTGQSNSDQNANIYGFVNNGGYGTTFERCIANSTQGLTVTGSSAVVAGFALLGTGTQSHKIIDCEGGNSTTSITGYAEPYGIYLKGILNEATVAFSGPNAQSDAIVRSAWSPDGAFYALGAYKSVASDSRLEIWSFDRVSPVVTLVASSANQPNHLLAVDWSPGNDIIAIGLESVASNNVQVYLFNRVNNTVQLLSQVTIASSPSIRVVAWSSDGRYLAVGTSTNLLNIYRYDPITQSLTLTDSYSSAGVVYSVSWSRSMKYVAMGGTASGSQVELFQFDASSGTIGSPFVTTNVGANVYGVQWSIDGNYLAVLGQVTSSATVRIYRFNGSSLTQTDAQDSVDVNEFSSLNWSPDMRYLAVAKSNGLGGDHFILYSFDKGAGTLTQISALSFATGDIYSCPWSPDGMYILVGTNDQGNDPLPSIYMLNAIQFPRGNIITNNKVYGNSGGVYTSGTGISGSSIVNYIIQNQAYNNPFNYIFVTNVFNQLFGLGPTLTQNSEVQQNVPILAPINITQTIDRSLFLLQELIDALI